LVGDFAQLLGLDSNRLRGYANRRAANVSTGDQEPI
jgi:hypothetical protein